SESVAGAHSAEASRRGVSAPILESGSPAGSGAGGVRSAVSGAGCRGAAGTASRASPAGSSRDGSSAQPITTRAPRPSTAQPRPARCALLISLPFSEPCGTKDGRGGSAVRRRPPARSELDARRVAQDQLAIHRQRPAVALELVEPRLELLNVALLAAVEFGELRRGERLLIRAQAAHDLRALQAVLRNVLARIVDHGLTRGVHGRVPRDGNVHIGIADPAERIAVLVGGY